jgi:hypothetical protein
MDSEQKPKRSYPARAFPLFALAFAAVTAGTVYPDAEQRPKASYPGRSMPAEALARAGAAAGAAYPDKEQLPKGSYPLGAHPLEALARANETVIGPRPGYGRGGLRLDPPVARKPRSAPDIVPLVSLLSLILTCHDD